MLIRSRMYVTLNGVRLEEVDCLKYLGSQVAADGRCKEMWCKECMRGISVGSAEKCAEQ